MIFIAGFVGFVLALAIVGIIVLIKRKTNNELPYKILVEIDGVKFVMDTLLLDMLKQGGFDDYGDRRVIMNNALQMCYNVMADGWKSDHKEKYARCGFSVDTADNLSCTITPLNLSEPL